MFRMRFCERCRLYTLSEMHCGKASRSAHPARFNPNDPYGAYRRRYRSGLQGPS